MAKSNALQILNKVQSNLGEPYTSANSFATISGLALLIFNTMNEILYELATEYKFQQNEVDVSIPIVPGTNTYTASVSLVDFDKKSFSYNGTAPIPYYVKDRIDREFPVKTNTSIPKVVYLWAGFFRVLPIPATSESGKTLQFGGWRVPTLYDTASTAGTSWIPEGVDMTLFTDYVTFKVLAYKGNPEAQVYYAKVFGTVDGKIEGSLSKFKRNHGSPQLLDNSIMIEPMEGNSRSAFVQPPISG